MERTRINKTPSAILTSDWHLREDTPTCFTGDWYSEQWEAVQFISDLQSKYNCPVLHAGDLYHHWKPSPWLLSKTMDYLPNGFYTIYGQHDLPQHQWELRDKSGIYALEKAGKLKVLGGWHYGENPNKGEGGMLGPGGTIICVWHHLTYTQAPFPGASGGMADGILRKYPQFSLIVTGDNHCSFTTTYEGRRLVNPGNLTRQVADQMDYQPRVALWYAEDNSITWVNLPIQKDAISRDHLEKKQERDQRIDAFVSKLNDDWVAEMSFEQNLENFFVANNIKDSVKQIIYKSIENEKS